MLRYKLGKSNRAFSFHYPQAIGPNCPTQSISSILNIFTSPLLGVCRFQCQDADSTRPRDDGTPFQPRFWLTRYQTTEARWCWWFGHDPSSVVRKSEVTHMPYLWLT